MNPLRRIGRSFLIVVLAGLLAAFCSLLTYIHLYSEAGNPNKAIYAVIGVLAFGGIAVWHLGLLLSELCIAIYRHFYPIKVTLPPDRLSSFDWCDKLEYDNGWDMGWTGAQCPACQKWIGRYAGGIELEPVEGKCPACDRWQKLYFSIHMFRRPEGKTPPPPRPERLTRRHLLSQD